MNICSIFDRLFRSSCLLCGDTADEVANVCNGCHGDLPVVAGTGCSRCAGPGPSGRPCPSCLRRNPSFVRTIAALRYEGAALHLLHRFKFNQDLAAGYLLGTLLGRKAIGGPAPDVLVPVPSSPRRRRQRGFDVALELARAVHDVCQVPLGRAVATRRVDRVPQSGITDWRQRRLNVAGVFHVKPGSLSGRRVAIVDDVMTSGATVEGLGRGLIAAGAAQVEVWVACRAGQGDLAVRRPDSRPTARCFE